MTVKTENRIPLTRHIQIDQDSHVLYFYSSEDQYIDNVVSFVLTAKELHQRVVYIDSNERYQKVLSILKQHLELEQIQRLLHYVNNYEFYEMYGDFHFSRVLENFKNTVQPFVDSQTQVRIWGHVDWKDQPNILEKLHTYECECDLSVSDLGFLTVCSYNAQKVPSYILTEMLRSHEYFMTDTELVRSTLYQKSNNVVFPSLSTQNRIETELDFYKQKLDFIHVVSHEVRNPLTVIKSFAAILQSELDSDRHREILQIIQDYSNAIDYEITHIIQTEQMLTTDSLWKTRLVNVHSILDEVIKIMAVKARTQNINLNYEPSLCPKLVLKGNILGYKLVFSNLISNAIKYSNENSDIYVYAFMSDSSFIFKVVDQGIGMSEEQIKLLFTKYEKMNHEKSGQGIGLFMVKKITDFFKGNVYVESQLGKGSAFTVELPL
ncbi:hypothetical protein GCM10008967_15730 [Bacillus carboniphilus]|uniref:histidine kinase n=1 Tax=Bacillus carboniphilus TaxID=86663 RepID=A0ABN0W5N7_9BACI